MKTYNTEAIVIKSIRYKDSDRIYTLFTEYNGKISAIARGVRKISSRRSGNLDTLNHIYVKIRESSKGFKSIEEVKTLETFVDIKKRLDLSKSAYYITELLHRNTEEESDDRALFRLLLTTLRMLPRNPDAVTTYFKINLLENLGYQLNLKSCINCGRSLDNTDKYTFKPDLGGFLCSNCSSGSVGISKDLLLNMRRINRGDVSLRDSTLMGEIKTLLDFYIDYKLENNLKSLQI